MIRFFLHFLDFLIPDEFFKLDKGSKLKNLPGGIPWRIIYRKDCSKGSVSLNKMNFVSLVFGNWKNYRIFHIFKIRAGKKLLLKNFNAENVEKRIFGNGRKIIEMRIEIKVEIYIKWLVHVSRVVKDIKTLTSWNTVIARRRFIGSRDRVQRTIDSASRFSTSIFKRFLLQTHTQRIFLIWPINYFCVCRVSWLSREKLVIDEHIELRCGERVRGGWSAVTRDEKLQHIERSIRDYLSFFLLDSVMLMDAQCKPKQKLIKHRPALSDGAYLSETHSKIFFFNWPDVIKVKLGSSSQSFPFFFNSISRNNSSSDRQQGTKQYEKNKLERITGIFRLLYTKHLLGSVQRAEEGKKKSCSEGIQSSGRNRMVNGKKRMTVEQRKN